MEDRHTHTTRKTSLRKVFDLEGEHHQRLVQYISDCHWMVFHATHVLKLYVLRHANFDAPIDIILIRDILYLVNGEYRPRAEERRTALAQLAPLLTEYRTHVPSATPIGMKSPQQTIHYLATAMLTNLIVNVQEHFNHMLLKFINRRLGVREEVRRLKEFPDAKERIRDYYKHIRQIKSLVTMAPDADMNIVLTELEQTLQRDVLAILPATYDLPEGLAYNVVAKPIVFIAPHCRLARAMEQYEIPQCSALPLRRSKILSHAPIDTKILCTHIFKDYTLIRNLAENKSELWRRLFKLDNKAFKDTSTFTFSGRITTDGTAVCVYLEKNNTKYGQKRKRMSKAALREQAAGMYFNLHLDEIRAVSNIVVIDPNKRDLLYCRDARTETPIRYTSNQRAVETRTRKYRTMTEAWKKEAGIDILESSLPSHKTMNPETYLAYLAKMEETLRPLVDFYARPIHRKLRLNVYINTLRSDDRFANKLKQTYGKDIAIIMGDWSDAGHTMKFQTSSKTKGWQKVFRRNRLPFFLIDEHRTSKLCPKCHGNTELPISRPSPRPWRKADGRNVRVTGLLGCKNLECLKQVDGPASFRFWNRDGASTLNMLHIVSRTMETGERPFLFSRTRPNTPS